MERVFNFIDGKFISPASGDFLDNANPAIGEVYSQLPDSDGKDVEQAVSAAQKTFFSWKNISAEARSKILFRLADLIEKNLDKLARAECVDTGKPLTLTRSLDIPRAVQNFRFFAAAATQFFSESHVMENRAINYTLREPHGVVACISPWNLPLYLLTWKIAPALAAGNTVVAKPSEVTPMTAFMFSELCGEAGVPPGVLNIVHGRGATVGEALLKHSLMKAISFTGGTQTGARIAELASPYFKKLSLEMGGKNPIIIFSDCRWEEMMKTTLRSSFENQGQICLCGSRIFIEQSIYEKFKKEFVERTKTLKIGDPLEEGTQQGAIVSEAHLNKIILAIELAKKEGGKILIGGKKVKLPGRCEKGYFVEPTVIEGLSSACQTNQEEIFGPLVTLMPFETEEEVLAAANSTSYGLVASLWTENLSRAHRMASQIQAGVVWVNCWLLRDLRTPFGGMKSSGLGREGGFEALRFFTEPKNVCVKWS